MADPVIRLDRSKPFAECRGDRTPDDPHYQVVFLQGAKVDGHTVNLPFDANDVLVPDDGRKEPWDGVDSEGKKIIHRPLYNDMMRKLVAYKLKKLAEAAAGANTDDGITSSESVIDEGKDGDPADEVNFASWLKGEARYEWVLLQGAAKKRYGRNFGNKTQMVVDLVLDEKVIPEAEVAPEFAKLLAAA